MTWQNRILVSHDITHKTHQQKDRFQSNIWRP